MPTDCRSDLMVFARLEGRNVVADFGGGAIPSDAGALLLGASDKATDPVDRIAACVQDGRRSGRAVHDLATPVGQRLFAIALGYEDLDDHDALRHAPALGTVLGRLQTRRPDCAPLPARAPRTAWSTPRAGPDRYHRIGHDAAAIEDLFVTLFPEAHEKPPKQVILDLDATDDPIHGHREGRFFHGCYDCYCYLPLYIFCGQQLLVAKPGDPTSMLLPVQRRRRPASSPRFVSAGPGSRSSCVPTLALPAMT